MAQGLLKSNLTRDGIAAVLAYNISDLEDQMYELQENASSAITQASNAMSTSTNALEDTENALAEMDTILESLSLSRASRLNRPNLLTKNWWTQREMPTSEVITETFTIPAETADNIGTQLTFTVENSAITTAYKLHGQKTSDYNVVSWVDISATFAAGVATIKVAARRAAHAGAVTVTVYLCTVASRNVCYGNASRISGATYPYLDSIYYGNYPGDDNTDGVVHSVVDLATADQIEEVDGETYTKALQFNITANTAYGNTEWLMFNNPNHYRVYTQGETKVSNYGHIEEMTPGKHYTVSCWARVISGDGAYLKFGHGGLGTIDPYNKTDGTSEVSGFVEVSGSEWQRYHWEFDFNPTGDWYTETSATVDGVVKVTRTYNWAKKVCFGVGRKYTSVVQLTGFRLVEGGLWLPTKYDEMREALDTAMTGFAEDLEGAGTTAAGNLAEEETTTAAGNHAAGELFTMGGKLYKATAAIAAGETIAVGTNCAETTAEGYFASKEYVEDAAVNTILVNLGTVNLGNGAVRFYPPFAASKYRPVELVLSNTDGLNKVEVKTGKTTAEYINLNATIKYTSGVTYNFNKDVTIKLEKIEKVFTYGADWTEEEVNGAKVDFTY